MNANIGIRAHDLPKTTLEQLPKIAAEKGYSAVQLAISKSFPELYPGAGSLTPGLAHYMKEQFAREGVQIAILGCYINMIHENDAEREKQLAKFKEHIRFARDVGCSIVATETGSVIPELGYTEENFTEAAFEAVVKSVQELVTEAEKFGIIVGIEGGINHPIHTPMRMKQLLDRIPSANLQVIYDHANFMTTGNYKQQNDVLDEAFTLFGERIVAIHAKDFIVRQHTIEMVPVGNGILNYPYVMKKLKMHKPYIYILTESTQEPYLNASYAYLQQQYANA